MCRHYLASPSTRKYLANHVITNGRTFSEVMYWYRYYTNRDLFKAGAECDSDGNAFHTDPAEVIALKVKMKIIKVEEEEEQDPRLADIPNHDGLDDSAHERAKAAAYAALVKVEREIAERAAAEAAAVGRAAAGANEGVDEAAAERGDATVVKEEQKIKTEHNRALHGATDGEEECGEGEINMDDIPWYPGVIGDSAGVEEDSEEDLDC